MFKKPDSPALTYLLEFGLEGLRLFDYDAANGYISKIICKRRINSTLSIFTISIEFNQAG